MNNPMNYHSETKYNGAKYKNLNKNIKSIFFSSSIFNLGAGETKKMFRNNDSQTPHMWLVVILWDQT